MFDARLRTTRMLTPNEAGGLMFARRAWRRSVKFSVSGASVVGAHLASSLVWTLIAALIITMLPPPVAFAVNTKPESANAASRLARNPRKSNNKGTRRAKRPQGGEKTIIISEFRLRGAAGALDEFVELANVTDADTTVGAPDGSIGWAIAALAPDGGILTVAVIPNGTIIPARGHFLIVNNSPNGYSLAAYPSGLDTTATGDLTFTSDIPDAAGIALFRTANNASFTMENRADAVGFNNLSGANATLYREGAGLKPIGSEDGEYSFVRRVVGIAPQDTDDNASDFRFVSTTGGVFGGAVSVYGAPAPQNLSAPVARPDSQMRVERLDDAVSFTSAPNQVYDQMPANGAPFGIISVRRKITNFNLSSIARLRFRIVELDAPQARAGLRNARGRAVKGRTTETVYHAISSPNANVSLSNDASVGVQGLTLELPGALSFRGGINSSLAASVVTLASPLAPDASLNVQFNIAVQKARSAAVRFAVVVETLTGGEPPGQTPSITDFTPKRGQIGSTVILRGTNLTGSTGNTIVTFTGAGGTRIAAQVSMASKTEVRVTVPNNAVTGRIELTTTAGTASTVEPFTIETSQDFSVTLAPTSTIAVERGSATYIVYVTSQQPDFTQLVKLSAVNLPQNAKATFDPEQLTAGASSVLTINLTDAALAVGTYQFNVRGTANLEGGVQTRSVGATLNVTPAGRTTLSGRVLSTDKEPIMGATVSLDGKTATTDAAGSFLLSDVTAGRARPLMVDGRTASAPNRTYPVILEPADIEAGRANVVPYIFYLPPIDTQYEVPMIPGQNTVATNPRVPGLMMMVPAGANLRNRDGSPVVRISITPLAIDRTPAPLPGHVATDMVYTSQPGGAVADMAMPVVYPNLMGTNPGTRIELYAFNHDTVQWYIYGHGRVSADGRTIVPEPGVGLRDFSWHFPNPPPEPPQPPPPCDPTVQCCVNNSRTTICRAHQEVDCLACQNRLR